MMVLVILAGPESNLPCCCVSHKMQDQEATMTVLAVSAVLAVLVMAATPLNSTPFSDILRKRGSVRKGSFY